VLRKLTSYPSARGPFSVSFPNKYLALNFPLKVQLLRWRPPFFPGFLFLIMAVASTFFFSVAGTVREIFPFLLFSPPGGPPRVCDHGFPDVPPLCPLHSPSNLTLRCILFAVLQLHVRTQSPDFAFPACLPLIKGSPPGFCPSLGCPPLVYGEAWNFALRFFSYFFRTVCQVVLRL